MVHFLFIYVCTETALICTAYYAVHIKESGASCLLHGVLRGKKALSGDDLISREVAKSVSCQSLAARQKLA